jgi:hypothetical protein
VSQYLYRTDLSVTYIAMEAPSEPESLRGDDGFHVPGAQDVGHVSAI